MADIDTRITDVLLQRPVGFKIGRKHFNIYPPTIGRMQLCSRLVQKIHFNTSIALIDPVLELMRLYKSYPKECCRIVAYATMNGKECLDNVKVKKVMDYLGKHADLQDMALLLQIVLMHPSTDDILEHYKIDKELKEVSRINQLKDESSTLTFCGKSIYGTTISNLAEKYGWTLDYILWEISLDNINLLMADSVKTIYLTDEEKKKIHPKSQKDVIFVDDPNNIELIKSMNFD